MNNESGKGAFCQIKAPLYWLGQGPVFGRSFSSSEKWSPNTKKPPAMRVVGNALAYRKKPPMIQYM